MQPATHPQRPALRKPLHPAGYTPALNLGGHNFAPIAHAAMHPEFNEVAQWYSTDPDDPTPGIAQ